MKNKNIILGIIAIICIMSIFIVPISSINDIDSFIKYDIFDKLRILFIVFSIILFLTNPRKTKFSYISSTTITIIFIIKIIMYREIDMSIIYISAGIIVVEHILINEININLVKKLFEISFYMYLIQLVVYSFNNYKLTGVLEIVSSAYDANYTGYFTFILGTYFLYINKRIKAIILFIVGLFTYSRLYIISLILFVILTKVCNKKVFINISTLIYSFWFYIAIQFLVVIVSLMYCNIYEYFKPEYVYLEGFSRMTNLLDESNYIRSQANLFALKSINLGNLLLGLQEGTFIGIDYFKGKTIFPHNLFWSMYVHFGMIITILFLSRYSKILIKYKSDILPFYFVIILYHSFLGLGPFYGIDLVIITFIVITICKENKLCSKE